MLKASLMILCDGCGYLFPISRFLDKGCGDWIESGEPLVQTAFEEGWAKSDGGCFHFCPVCIHELEDMALALTS